MRNLSIVLPLALGFAFLAGCSVEGQTGASNESPDALAAKPPIQAEFAPTEVKIENLMKQALSEDFTKGREVIVDLVEIPPNTTLDRHWHPGEEFHYYLEGEVEIQIDGKPSIIGTPGKVGHIPYKVLHTAVTKEKPAKALVIRVHTAGEPARYLEKGGSAAK